MKALAESHIAELETKLRDLQVMKATLEHLVHCCHSDDRPECPIIETLESDTAPVQARPRDATAGLHGGRRARISRT